MPDCPPRSAEERQSDRWEFVVGKSLKDWVSAVMTAKRITRDEARKLVLQDIKNVTDALSGGSV